MTIIIWFFKSIESILKLWGWSRDIFPSGNYFSITNLMEIIPCKPLIHFWVIQTIVCSSRFFPLKGSLTYQFCKIKNRVYAIVHHRVSIFISWTLDSLFLYFYAIFWKYLCEFKKFFFCTNDSCVLPHLFTYLRESPICIKSSFAYRRNVYDLIWIIRSDIFKSIKYPLCYIFSKYHRLHQRISSESIGSMNSHRTLSCYKKIFKCCFVCFWVKPDPSHCVVGRWRYFYRIFWYIYIIVLENHRVHFWKSFEYILFRFMGNIQPNSSLICPSSFVNFLKIRTSNHITSRELEF